MGLVSLKATVMGFELSAPKYAYRLIMRNVNQYQETLILGGDRANAHHRPDMSLNVDIEEDTPHPVLLRPVRGTAKKKDRLAFAEHEQCANASTGVLEL
jgi:hypothetical protein